MELENLTSKILVQCSTSSANKPARGRSLNWFITIPLKDELLPVDLSGTGGGGGEGVL